MEAREDDVAAASRRALRAAGAGDPDHGREEAPPLPLSGHATVRAAPPETAPPEAAPLEAASAVAEPKEGSDGEASMPELVSSSDADDDDDDDDDDDAAPMSDDARDARSDAESDDSDGGARRFIRIGRHVLLVGGGDDDDADPAARPARLRLALVRHMLAANRAAAGFDAAASRE